MGSKKIPKIGVLALQGAVAEHMRMLELCGAQAVLIKRIEEMADIQALVIPGGESTTIGKLMVKYGFVGVIRKKCEEGMPILGTCAGLIILAKELVEGEQTLLKLMDMKVRRNAFGRQKESFEVDLEIQALGNRKFPGVFIRAPWIEEVGSGVKVMSRFRDKIVMAQDENILVSAFHPELTEDLRIHEYFVEMAKRTLSRPRKAQELKG